MAQRLTRRQNGADYRIEFEPVYELSHKRRQAQKKQWAKLARQLDGPVVVKGKEVVMPELMVPVDDDFGASSLRYAYSNPQVATTVPTTSPRRAPTSCSPRATLPPR